MDIQQTLFLLFGAIIIIFLIADLGIFNRQAHRISAQSALIQSIFWIAISFAFAFLILIYLGREMAAQFMSAYVTEKLLSVDNLFVFMLIFSFFKLEEKYHHKVLFWGILGAIIFRALFISIGAYIIDQFHWVLYIFGAILIYTGIKLLWQKKEQHVDINKYHIFRLAHKYLPFTASHHDGKFIVKEKGRYFFTILFMIVLLIETTDIVFAIDSIPAAFAITQNSFIIYTSNIFAVMGLRALFFLIENILHKFHHLQKGLAFILIFIGLKMILTIFDLHLSSGMSFIIIMSALGISLLLSIMFPKEI